MKPEPRTDAPRKLTRKRLLLAALLLLLCGTACWAFWPARRVGRPRDSWPIGPGTRRAPAGVPRLVHAGGAGAVHAVHARPQRSPRPARASHPRPALTADSRSGSAYTLRRTAPPSIPA